MKLPFHCHEKWRNIVISIRDSGGTVAFHNLVKFVKREARKATDPMYGKDALRNDDRTKPQPKRNAGIASQSSFKPSFSTDMVENTTQNTQSSKPEEKAAEERKEMSQEDKEFMKIVTNSIHKEDGHYVVSLPFRDKDVIMPDNSEQALQRLRGLKKKFTMNPQIHKDYKKFMEDILSKEYAEIVPQDELKDDCLASDLNEENAVSTVKELTSLCSEGSFRLTKWISNSSTVMKSIPPQERAKDVKDLNLDCEDLPSERALGVYWFVQSDTLGFKIKSKLKPDTKRGILSVVSSVYDPLGLMAPFILISKQLLQNLHKEQKDWDEDVDSKIQKIWHQWLKDLSLLENIHIPRCYKPMGFGLVTSCQLHLFADASNVGYGVVGYIRFVNEDEEIHCALVMSKSRVAPLKKTTIPRMELTVPRMELTAATLAVRMSSLILQELQVKVDTTFFWTDSMSVLRCIFNTNARFKTFVANRIAVIRDCSDIDQWRYVSSKENPASRGIELDNEQQIQHWTGGPRFLWRHHKYWPKQYSKQEPQEDDLELKECVHATIMEKDSFLDILINHFSSWTKLRRAVAWIILTIRCLRQSVNKSHSTKKVNFTLNVQVLEDAEKLLVQHCQTQHFSKEQ
ncbi:uncharacterized protein [Haliotis cracherodii]|uniref:uncharacterized protein n=1 Tax=Haliotis cracherodii TaxID=6455 RepID=UPI0039E80B8B